MNRLLIVGNWKMHLNTSQASLLLHRLHERIKIYRDIEVVLAPNTLVLQPLSMQLDRRKFRLSAQNAYFKDEGAYTGEVSFTQLRDLVHYVIIGHSERRNIFNETHDEIRDKVAACVRNEIIPILCIGENKTERLANETKLVLHDQLMTALSHLTGKEVKNIVIAYEPVWAIGTGTVASPNQVAEAVAYIRKYIGDTFSSKTAKSVRILYGGSVVPDVVKGFLEIEGVNGFLVGGASINYHQFSGIIDNSNQFLRESVE